MSEPIEFQATVYKVQTLVDMGLRVTLDLPEDAITQAAQLMACKREGMSLFVTLSTDDPQKRRKTGDDRPGPSNRKIRQGQ